MLFHHSQCIWAVGRGGADTQDCAAPCVAQVSLGLTILPLQPSHCALPVCGYCRTRLPTVTLVVALLDTT